MPTSFLDLPLELRDEIYKLIIPVERGADGEPLPVETDITYWEDHPPRPWFGRLLDDEPLPESSKDVLRLGSRLLRTCRQVSDEAAPYVYGQQQFNFYRPPSALNWLDSIGQHHIRLRRVAVLGYSLTDQTLEEDGEVQIHMWASVLRKLSNVTFLNCLTNLHRGTRGPWLHENWSTIWDKEVVLEALRDLVHVRVMSIADAPRVTPQGPGMRECPLEPTFNKAFLETLILTGHPVAGIEWYPEDYFDRLTGLKHLTILNGLRMQSGNSKVSNDFFSHVAPLRSFTWHGFYLTNSHRKAFTTYHGGTIQFLELDILMKYLENWTAQRSEESAFLDSLTKMFAALPILKVLNLRHWDDCARLIENMPRGLRVLSLSGGANGTRFPRTDESLGHALRKLPDRCPQLAHVRLTMDQRIVGEDHMGRCGTLSIHTHAALEYLSSKIKDTFVTGCVARRCDRTAPMGPELTDEILACWKKLPRYPISNIDLDHPWERDYAALESVIGLT